MRCRWRRRLLSAAEPFLCRCTSRQIAALQPVPALPRARPASCSVCPAAVLLRYSAMPSPSLPCSSYGRTSAAPTVHARFPDLLTRENGVHARTDVVGAPIRSSFAALRALRVGAPPSGVVSQASDVYSEKNLVVFPIIPRGDVAMNLLGGYFGVLT